MCRSPCCGVRAKTTDRRIARDSSLVRPSLAAVNSHRADGMTGQRGTAADNNSTAQERPALEGGTDTESACGGYAAIAGQVLKSQFRSRFARVGRAGSYGSILLREESRFCYLLPLLCSYVPRVGSRDASLLAAGELRLSRAAIRLYRVSNCRSSSERLRSSC